MKTKLLTIILPVKNIKTWESNIIKNINIVNRENLNDVEFIFVYSKEKDNSIKSLEKKIVSNKNIKFIRDNNKDIYSAMNCGISNSIGKYLQFMGADDTYNEIGLNKIIKLIKNKTEHSIILCEATLSTDKTNNPEKGNKFASGLGGRVHWLLSSPRIHQAIIYKRSIIEKNNSRFQTNLKVTSDYIFTAELLSKSQNIKAMNICFVNYYKYGFSSNFSLLNNYIEHIKGFSQSKILRKYLLLVIASRCLMMIYKLIIISLKVIFLTFKNLLSK